MSHDQTARRVFGVSFRTLQSRIERVLDKATEADIEAGARWYDEAGSLSHEIAAESAGRVSADQVAAIISHLSPRQQWGRNILAARALAVEDRIISGIMGREAARAASVLNYDGDLVNTFGGNKTRRFYLNIIGDREAVTVDVWACRVAGVDENLLDRKGAYACIEAAYQSVARRVGLDPVTVQASTWIVARGGRAS